MNVNNILFTFIFNVDINIINDRGIKVENENIDLVLNCIKRNGSGLTITNLVDKLKISRSTIRTALANLEGAKLVSVRNVGMAKLYAQRRDSSSNSVKSSLNLGDSFVYSKPQKIRISETFPHGMNGVLRTYGALTRGDEK